MFGTNSDDDEKWKNLLLFNVWGTDKEVEEALPFIAIAIVVIVIIFALIYFL